MIIARLRVTAPVFPFETAAADLPVSGATLCSLSDFQAAAAKGAGLTLRDIAPGDPLPAGAVLLALGDAVFSSETLTAALQQHNDKPAGIVPAPGSVLGRTLLHTAPFLARAPICRHPTGLFITGGATRVDEILATPHDITLPVALCDGAYAIRTAPQGNPAGLVLPQNAVLLGRLWHWLAVLDLGLATWLRHHQQDARLAARKNRMGDDVNIHPTAYVSGSVLEDGVRIEAHASVINSHIGKDALIADHSVVVDCVLGAHTRTLVDTSLRRCLALGDSTLSNVLLADAVFGSGVFVTTAVGFFGPAPGEQPIVDGVAIPRAVLGGAVGKGAILGARALLKSGVAVPPGALVVARPHEAVAQFTPAALEKSGAVAHNPVPKIEAI